MLICDSSRYLVAAATAAAVFVIISIHLKLCSPTF